MSDPIHVEPARLREAAAHHWEVADHLRTVPSSHAAIQQSLDSLGPVFGEFRDAGRELLELRRRCYEQQADDHADLAEKLTTSAAVWEQHEQDAARDFRGIVEGGGCRTLTPPSTPSIPADTSLCAAAAAGMCTASR